MPPKGNNAKKIWDSLGVKIGVISGTIGIVLGIISIVSAFRPDEKEDLETKELELKLKDYNPKLEIAYVVTQDDIYGLSRTDDSLDRKKAFFVDFQVMSNKITSSDDLLFPSDYDEEDGFFSSTVYLMIQNKGKVAASNIQLQLDESTLRNPVKIPNGPEDSDYRSRIASGSAKQKLITLTLPISLETGEGILIPLMISEMKSRYNGPSTEWKVISKTAYLPKSVQYKNALSEEIFEEAIRQMTAPVRISEGVEVRG